MTMSQETFIEELQEILLETLENVVEAMAGGVCPPTDCGDPTKIIEAQVPIVGELQGMLTVRVNEPTGLGLAAVWAGMDPQELDAQDALDTMSEFCNVFGGTAKTVLPAETSLDVPQVRSGTAAELGPLAGSAPVGHELGVFEVQLCV